MQIAASIVDSVKVSIEESLPATAKVPSRASLIHITVRRIEVDCCLGQQIQVRKQMGDRLIVLQEIWSIPGDSLQESAGLNADQ